MAGIKSLLQCSEQDFQGTDLLGSMGRAGGTHGSQWGWRMEGRVGRIGGILLRMRLTTLLLLPQTVLVTGFWGSVLPIGLGLRVPMGLNVLNMHEQP